MDIIYSLVKPKDRKPDRREKLAWQNSKLGLDKYYEGEQHQSGRHVIVILCQVLLMIVVSALHLKGYAPCMKICAVGYIRYWVNHCDFMALHSMWRIF